MRIRGIILAACAVFLVSGVFLGAGDFINRKWDGKSRFTVINVLGGMFLESIDPATNTGLRITFPDNFDVETVGGRGSWQIKAMDDLAVKFGNKWVADSLSDYLGISYTAENRDLGFWDRVGWWNLSRSVQWKEVNLGDTDYITDQREVDGTVVKKLDRSWGKKAGEWFIDAIISGEGMNIYIVNTTKETGLGNHAAVFIENAGAKVAMVESNLQILDKCMVSGTKGALESATANLIIRFLSCNTGTGGDSDKELTLKLGQVYRLWWKGQF